MSIIFFDMIPALRITGTLIVKANVQVRGTPAEAVAHIDRRDLPQIHFLTAMWTYGLLPG
jgi:hypothetical protein